MPYTRALKYLHAALWANGAWTVKRCDAPKMEIAHLMELSENIRHDENESDCDF